MAFGGVYVDGEGWGLEGLLLLVDLVVVQPRVYLALKVYCWVVLVVARGGENWGRVEFAFKWVVDPFISKEYFDRNVNSFRIPHDEALIISERFERKQEGDQEHIRPQHRSFCQLCSLITTPTLIIKTTQS